MNADTILFSHPPKLKTLLVPKQEKKYEKVGKRMRELT
jgi:hypothetical protein